MGQSLLEPREIICGLAQHVKSAVYPHLGTWRARRVTGIASSGDATFDIDEIAEKAVEAFILDNGINVAYYSEDRGLIQPIPGREPEAILIIDPIDGTRGAIAGFEACVVSIAWASNITDPTLADVQYGAIVEIKGNRTYYAERGGGATILDPEAGQIAPSLSPNMNIPGMAWATEVVGAPMEILFKAMSGFANQTTVTGGMFVLNSSAYELTRLVTGQLGAVIDIRNRVLVECPTTRALFNQYGGGRLLSLYGYDIAAAALIVQESGGCISDAWGATLANWKLLDTTESNFGSLIACSNVGLHAKLVAEIDAGVAELRRSLSIQD